MKSPLLALLGLLAITAALSLPARADAIDVTTLTTTCVVSTTGTCNTGTATDITLTSTLVVDPDAGTFSLDFNVANGSSTNTADIFSASLQLFNPGTVDATSATLPTGWEYFNNTNGQNNGIASQCKLTPNSGWLCMDDFTSNQTVGPTPADIAPLSSIDFLFSGTFTGTEVSAVDFQTNGLLDITDTHSKWAVSDTGSSTSTSGGSQPPPPLPEPSSLLLLGSGLLGIGTLLRRKLMR